MQRKTRKPLIGHLTYDQQADSEIYMILETWSLVMTLCHPKHCVEIIITMVFDASLKPENKKANVQ